MEKQPNQEFPKGLIGNISIPVDFSHLIIFVLNGSVSMNRLNEEKITKGQMVSCAVKDIFCKFKCSLLRINFSFAVIYYDNEARIELNITPTIKVDEMRSYDPTVGMGALESFVSVGISLAGKLAKQHLEKTNQLGTPKSASIVILTFGYDSKQQDALEIAKSVKANPKIEIITCYLESVDEINDNTAEMDNFYKEISSNIYYFKKTKTIDELGSFLNMSLYHNRKLSLLRKV